MYATYIQSTSVGNVKSIAAPGGVSESDLENTVGINLLADYNQQLADLSQVMRDQLTAKNDLSSEVGSLQTFAAREHVKTPTGENAVTVSAEEKAQLETAGYDFNYEDAGNGKSYLKLDSLENTITQKQGELSTMNSTSELTMLNVQSIIDQRKNAIMFLSNLMSSKNDTLMNIIRNLKN